MAWSQENRFQENTRIYYCPWKINSPMHSFVHSFTRAFIQSVEKVQTESDYTKFWFISWLSTHCTEIWRHSNRLFHVYYVTWRLTSPSVSLRTRRSVCSDVIDLHVHVNFRYFEKTRSGGNVRLVRKKKWNNGGSTSAEPTCSTEK